MNLVPRLLEPHIDWLASDVADPRTWTIELTEKDHQELDAALQAAKTKSDDLLLIDRSSFPLDRLSEKIAYILSELIDGRGFVRISSLNMERYSDDDLTWLFWGIGLHLGVPWPQNRDGHVLGDVTDQGFAHDAQNARGNQVGGAAPLPHHSDGSDLVGLLCLRTAKSGGESFVANAVAIHNELVRKRPDIAAILYQEFPHDRLGEHLSGDKRFVMNSVFTEYEDRLYVRFLRGYIHSSQRHPEAPRLTDEMIRSLEAFARIAAHREFNVVMALRPGDMQFINNYHVVHGRLTYVDDPSAGYKRHLKRLWLASDRLTEKPLRFRRPHWKAPMSASWIPAVDRPVRTGDI